MIVFGIKCGGIGIATFYYFGYAYDGGNLSTTVIEENLIARLNLVTQKISCLKIPNTIQALVPLGAFSRSAIEKTDGSDLNNQYCFFTFEAPSLVTSISPFWGWLLGVCRSANSFDAILHRIGFVDAIVDEQERFIILQ